MEKHFPEGRLNHGWPILTTEQMRWSDTYTINALGIAGEILMAAAGDRVVETAMQLVPEGPVCVVAGPGNNGGDGFVAAGRLQAMQRPVVLLLVGRLEQLRGDAATVARRAGEAGVPIIEVVDEAGLQAAAEQLAAAGLIIDAMFGTGLGRALDGLPREMVDRINAAGRPVLAVDIASGIHGDTGEVFGAAVRATWTLPIAACKWGHWLGDGYGCAGRVLAPAAIGIPADIIREAWEVVPGGYRSALVMPADLPGRFWQPRRRQSHKGMFGHVWIFGGSEGFAGAPRLAAHGAFAAGAGLVSIACPESVWQAMTASELDAMVHPDSTEAWKKANVIVAGPGWGKAGMEKLPELIAADCSLVVDADGLNLLAGSETLASAMARRSALSVLTPHPGEAGRLLGMPTAAVQHDRRTAALDLARCFRAWVVLKGAGSLVVSPAGDIWLCPFGSPNLAQAGTGDVLAGMIGAVLAHGLPPEMAIPAAVALHAIAGEADDWFMASGLAGKVAQMRRELENRGIHAAGPEQ